MFELYLNDIYDLLAGENFYGPNPSGQGLACYEPLPGREDRHMAELTELEVTDVTEAIELVLMGTTRRRYSPMPLNPVSSRSHCILRIGLHLSLIHI